ncbi:MAG: hypothetical protein QF464_22215 [Myxococcota bacterium]|nr:hypothetical protein [Myxococcota bacterium]
MRCPLLSLFTGCALLAALASGCAESAESTATATSVAAKLSVCMGAEIEETWVGVLAVAISYPDTVYASIRQSDLSCVSEAANCFAVFECLGHDTDQACRGSSFGSTCIDETAQMCTTVNSAGYGWVLEDDCTAGLSAEMGNDECMIGEWDWSEASCYAGTCEDATSWCVGPAFGRSHAAHKGKQDSPQKGK